MTAPLDEKGLPKPEDVARWNADAERQALENLRASQGLSAVSLPDELEGSGLVNDLRSASRKVTALKEYTTLAGAAKTTLHRLAETSARAADALSQANSTIAALRAEIEQAELREGALMRDCEVYKGHAADQLERALAAEAQLKRLTEENEALRGVLREALYAITEIDNAHKVVRKIRAILTQENADGQ